MPKKLSITERIENVINQVDDFRCVLIALSSSSFDELDENHIARIFSAIDVHFKMIEMTLIDIQNELEKKDKT